MTAQQALKVALRDLVGPAIRRDGYKGSGTTWRRLNSLGDIAIVNVQSSQWSSATSVKCVINIAVSPAPWRDWKTSQTDRVRKSVKVTDGLFRDRLHPQGTAQGIDSWWHISGTDATAVAQDMVRQLADRGLPLLARLLTRDGLVSSIRAGDLGHISRATSPFAWAEAALLADDGPSSRLDELLEFARVEVPPSHQSEGRVFESWVRNRAEGG